MPSVVVLVPEKRAGRKLGEAALTRVPEHGHATRTLTHYYETTYTTMGPNSYYNGTTQASKKLTTHYYQGHTHATEGSNTHTLLRGYTHTLHEATHSVL